MGTQNFNGVAEVCATAYQVDGFMSKRTATSYARRTKLFHFPRAVLYRNGSEKIAITTFPFVLLDEKPAHHEDKPAREESLCVLKSDETSSVPFSKDTPIEYHP